MSGILRAIVAAAALTAVLVGPGQASAAFPGSNGELLFDASADPDFDGVFAEMIGTLDPASVVPPDPGVPTWLTQGSDPASAPDGVRIAFVRDGDIWLRDGDGSELRLVADPASDREPAWSPDGGSIVFTSERGGGPDLYSVEVASREVDRLTVGGAAAANSQPAWSAGGDRIAFTHVSPYARETDSGEARQIWLMPAPGALGATFPIDPADAASGARQLSGPGCLDDEACTPATPYHFGGLANHSAGWSPDGTELVFASGVTRFNLAKLQVSDPSSHATLTAIDVNNSSPAWAPDGQRIAFARPSFLITMQADGGGTTQLLLGPDVDVPLGNVDWRPLAVANTPVGLNVPVSLAGVTLNFAQVTAAGNTSVVLSPSGPAPPAGFRVVGSYHEISTTATYAGDVTVCIDRPDPQARLEHFENGSWTDVTTSSSATQVCGVVSSLSPFALFVPSDSSPPVLTHPDALAVDASGPAGAVVTYTAAASDDQDPSPVVSCAPRSGATFPIGRTTVNCTASDAAGNSATGSFVVTVRGASAQLVALIDKTLAYLELPPLKAALKAPLEAAAAALIANNKPAACRALGLYVVAVKAAPARVLTAAEKTELVADATRIKAVVGGP